MADNKFDALFEKARNAGVDPDLLDEFQSTYEASGLRKDMRELQDKLKTQAELNRNLRSGLLADRFKTMGISISPKALNIPDDLDPTDPEKVTSWAEDMGLVQKKETTTPETRAVHDRIANASNEGGNTQIPDLPDPATVSEDEYYRIAAIREEALIRNRT